MKLSILVTMLAWLMSSVAAWGTVKLSIYPGVIDLNTVDGSVEGIKNNLLNETLKLCTNGPSDIDRDTGLVWHHCSTDKMGSISSGTNTIGVKVNGSAWRDDNPTLRDSLINAITSTWKGMAAATTDRASKIPSRLTIQTGLEGENYLNMDLVNKTGHNQSTKLTDTGASREFCNTLIPYATSVLDGLMVEFNTRLGGGSTTRVVQCVDNEGNELQTIPVPVIQKPKEHNAALGMGSRSGSLAVVGLVSLAASAWLAL